MNIREDAVLEATNRYAPVPMSYPATRVPPRLAFVQGVDWALAQDARKPSGDDFNAAAQRFYEASGLEVPHTVKPMVIAGVRAAWDSLSAVAPSIGEPSDAEMEAACGAIWGPGWQVPKEVIRAALRASKEVRNRG